jgi:hypothetical protein
MTLHVNIGAYQPGYAFSRDINLLYKNPSMSVDDDPIATQLIGTHVSGDYWIYSITIVSPLPFADNCGYGCRFTDDTTTSVNIFNGNYFNTDVNNRLANRYFPSYRMDPRSPLCDLVWHADLSESMSLVSNSYDGVYGDSFETDFSNHNIYPNWVDSEDDYHTPTGDYTVAMIDLIDRLRSSMRDLYGYDKLLMTNWARHPAYDDAMTIMDGALIEDFAADWEDYGDDTGSIYSEQEWYRKINDAIEMVQNSTMPIYLLAESTVNRYSDRIWALASYFLVSDVTDRVHISARELYNYLRPISMPPGITNDDRDWAYYPEFQLNMGQPESSYDPFLNLSAYTVAAEKNLTCSVPPGLPGIANDGQIHRRIFENGTIILNSAYCRNSSPDWDYVVNDSCTYELVFDDKHILEGGRFYTEYREPGDIITLQDGNAHIFMEMACASPLLDASFTTTIYTNADNQRLHAHATSWNGDPMWFEVDAEALGLGSQMILSAGPVLYESEPFTCSAAAGTYPLPVYIRDDSGYALYDTLVVEVEESPELVAKYVNKSTSVVDLNYPGIPYSEITLDYDNDDREDLLITLQSSSPRLFRNAEDGLNGVPEFEPIPNAFDNTINNLLSARGSAAADYNNDGHIDLFIAHETHPMLLRNRGPNTTPRFVNDGLSLTYQVIENEQTVTHYTLEKSWAGTWGDMNNDGLVDLLVTRADAAGATKLQGTHTHHPFVLLLNQSTSNQTAFGMMSQLFGGNEAPPITASSASWVDIDADGWLDLFLPSLGDPADTRLYHRTAPPYYTDEFTSRFPGVELVGVDAAVWADLNRDGLPDMISTERGGDRLRLFMNDPANPGHFVDCSAWADATGPATDLRPVDFDLDGWTDLVAVADETTTQPGVHLLRNTGDVRLPGGFPYFKDVSSEAGFTAESERVSGMAAADFLNDGDVDFLLGRERAHNTYYFSAVNADGVTEPPSSHWLGIRLNAASAANNSSGIGAVVTVEAGGASTTQVVDGGSGLGGQQSAALRFGLGDVSSGVMVRTRWPGGFEQIFENVTVDSEVTIQDETDPTVIESSLVANVYYIPNNTLTWVLTWDTAYSYAPDCDRVLIAAPGLAPITYAPSSAGVIATSGSKSGGGYWHRFQISGVKCDGGNYAYSVVSDTHAPQFTEHTTASGNFMSYFCTHGGGEPNVEE